MARAKDNYQVTGQTVEELRHNLNFLLQRMADRMDKIEGIRGDASIDSSLSVGPVEVQDADDNIIHSLE